MLKTYECVGVTAVRTNSTEIDKAIESAVCVRVCVRNKVVSLHVFNFVTISLRLIVIFTVSLTGTHELYN